LAKTTREANDEDTKHDKCGAKEREDDVEGHCQVPLRMRMSPSWATLATRLPLSV
jgi:hypothetical protein